MKGLDTLLNEFLRALVAAVLRIVYSAKDVHFINNDTSVVFRVGDDTKYASVQFFDYETEKFVFNKDTFNGETGVVLITRSYICVFNIEKLKTELSKYKQYIRKNKHGDWEIDMTVVKSVVKIIGADDEKKLS